MEGESAEAFNTLLDSLTNIFLPLDAFEASLIETMALAKWRFLRLVGMERAGMRQHAPESLGPESDAADRAFGAFTHLARQHNTLQMLSRYETRCDRQYNRAIDMLRQHRLDLAAAAHAANAAAAKKPENMYE